MRAGVALGDLSYLFHHTSYRLTRPYSADRRDVLPPASSYPLQSRYVWPSVHCPDHGTSSYCRLYNTPACRYAYISIFSPTWKDYAFHLPNRCAMDPTDVNDETGFIDDDYANICEANRRAVKEIDYDDELARARNVLDFIPEEQRPTAWTRIIGAVSLGWRFVRLYDGEANPTDADLVGIDPVTGTCQPLPAPAELANAPSGGTDVP